MIKTIKTIEVYLTLFTCTVGGQYRVTARCVLANGGA